MKIKILCINIVIIFLLIACNPKQTISNITKTTQILDSTDISFIRPTQDFNISYATKMLITNIAPSRNNEPKVFTTKKPFLQQYIIDQAIKDLKNKSEISMDKIIIESVKKIELPFQDRKCLNHYNITELPAYTITIEILLRINTTIYRYITIGNHVIYCP
ncbi:MAG: hypothetical protein ACPL0B_01225 [Anaerolineales bacterium]